MLLFVAGALVGLVVAVLFYHFHLLKELRKWGGDWRARAISAEQEVENWKVWAKHNNVNRGY
jgi:hypothetical protein